MLESRQGDTFQPGDLLNNTLRVEGILGRGGTSEVYKAKNEVGGRVFAVKVLSSEFSQNDDYLELLKREEEIREIRHPAVVQYSGIFRTADDHVYLVMDFVDGPGLDKLMRTEEMQADDLMRIAARVADGLVATHARNIIHRDLSPDNVILRNGDAGSAVIIDFGIARDTNPGAQTIVGNDFAGKYAYAAPEQLSGQSDPRSDLYALGALLLAAYNGKAPDVGSNPMEIVTAKKAPLDTSSVPQPLKSLIDRLTAPDPDDRPASATDVLALIDPKFHPPDRPTTHPPTIGLGSEAPATPAPAAKKKSGGGLVKALLALIVLGGAGAAGWFFREDLMALVGPSYPEVDPYTLSVTKLPDNPPFLNGHAPSEEIKAALEEAMSGRGGSADIQLATGTFPEAWGDGVLALVGHLETLEEWNISFVGGTFTAAGLARTTAERVKIATRLSDDVPAGFSGTSDIIVGPRELSVATVETALATYEDCGPLTLENPPVESYPIGARINVSGTTASEDASRIVFDALTAIAGDRIISLDMDVLNPELCAVEKYMPELSIDPSGEVTFLDGSALGFSEGISGRPVPDGAYQAGENPVLDLVLPAGMVRGFLWVTLVDVTGNAYHILPNINRLENSVAILRGETEGELVLRLTYTVGEGQADPSKLAFQVDDTSGKSKVLIFHSSAPLFDELRPTTESAQSFADALRDRISVGGLSLYSLVTRIIESG